MFLYKKYILVIFIAAGFFLWPFTSHAETHVQTNDLISGAAWNKEGSPYILEDNIYLPSGSGLSITEGVVIRSATSTFGDEKFSLRIEGNISVIGTEPHPVVFENLGDLYFFKSDSSLIHAIFKNVGLTLQQSTTSMRNVSISGTRKAITTKASKVDIRDSEISNNDYGIVSNLQVSGPFPMLRAQVLGEVDHVQNSILINNSVILDNKIVSISNQTSNTIDARENWWGSADGPRSQAISGLVETSRWKQRDPREKGCCSNVLFLPGFQASRLGKESGGEATTTLWEPKKNDAVRSLYMNDLGKSMDQKIVPDGVIDSAYGLVPIYESFIAMMNGVVADGEINAWSSMSYDWRNNVKDIVTDAMIQKVEDLAATSRTRKIQIIAHSNGGLVAKELVRRLELEGKDSVIEKMILVATPELGTPQALLGMLHGEKQSIGFGAILSKKTARAFSLNMPGAYGLLPSREFFLKNTSNLIITNSRPITTYEEMKKFLTENPWSGASSSPTTIPMKLMSAFVLLADTLHHSLDTWKPKGLVEIISIAGWGLDTGAGISYITSPHCSANNNCSIERKTTLSERGDGTVLTASLVSETKDKTIFFNLKDFINETWHVVNHANILEARPLVDLLRGEITATRESITSKYFSMTEPVSIGKQLTLRFHSPVDVDIYTPDGRHTGLVPNPILGSDLFWMEDQIGAYVSGFEDPEDVKEISVPYGPLYQIAVKGNGVGAVIIDAEVRGEDNRVIASTTFREMPVTPLTNIDLVIATSSTNLAMGSLMYLDVDGDGTTDLVQRTATALKASSTAVVADFSAYIEAMKKTIMSLKLSAKQEKLWLEKLDRILEKKFKKHPRKAEKIARKLSVKHFKGKKLTDPQKTTILKVFETLATRIESENFTNIDQ